jgi:chorismate mutase-like protein
MGTIEGWRTQINQVDTRLLALLNRRARLAQRIARIKQRTGRRLWSPTRERAVLQRMAELNAGPLDSRAVQRLFRSILRESRRTQAAAINGKGKGQR